MGSMWTRNTTERQFLGSSFSTLYPKALSRQCYKKCEEIMKAMVQSCLFSVAFNIRLSNLKQTRNRWACCHTPATEVIPVSAVHHLPKHGIPAVWQHGRLWRARQAQENTEMTLKQHLCFNWKNTQAPFAVSSVEEGGKQTLQRAFPVWQHRQCNRFMHCSVYWLS